MNELEMFNNDNFGEVRAFKKDDEVWFVAKDVCNSLEIKNTTDAVKRLDGDEKGLDSIYTPGGDQEMTVVNEFGLYNLVLGSRKKEAKEFKRWITHEVLPDIRKNGMYATESTVEKMLNDPESAIEMLEEYKEVKEENQSLQTHKSVLDKNKKSLALNGAPSNGNDISIKEFVEWINEDLEEHQLSVGQFIRALQGDIFKKTSYGEPYKSVKGKYFQYQSEAEENGEDLPIIRGEYIMKILNKLCYAKGNKYESDNDYYHTIMELAEVMGRSNK